MNERQEKTSRPLLRGMKRRWGLNGEDFAHVVAEDRDQRRQSNGRLGQTAPPIFSTLLPGAPKESGSEKKVRPRPFAKKKKKRSTSGGQERMQKGKRQLRGNCDRVSEPSSDPSESGGG